MRYFVQLFCVFISLFCLPIQAEQADRPLTLGVVLYPGFEPLDVFGPVEMFANVGSDKLKIVMIADQAELVGSAILAKAGLLDGHKATSNKLFFFISRKSK